VDNISLEKFLQLSKQEISDIVHSSGTQTCVFPFNGTRRWFLLEHGGKKFDDWMEAYNDLTGKRYIEMYQMLFENGIHTVLEPIFGGDIMERGQEYMEKIGSGLSRLAEHPDFVDFYKEHEVRVHFYGDYRKKFSATPYSYLTDLFDKITRETAHYKKNRLFYGVFGSDATESIAEFSAQYFQQNAKLPEKREIVENYYGEYLEKADLFIGFEKFSAFDYPMLNTGEESLYFTVAPSLYMTERQLREILYDHVFLRPVDEPDYSEMSREEFIAMNNFYSTNREVTYGVGEIRGGIWYGNASITVNDRE
jgi:hypothetical protein